jgi:ribose transport system substrate-binding protein
LCSSADLGASDPHRRRGTRLQSSRGYTQALAALQEKILSKGPNGEEPSPASSVSLTTEEIEKIRGLKAKAAIVLHYARNNWSEAQVAGLKSQFDKMGIEVIALTDADFLPDRQVAKIENGLMKNPQIIVSIPTDAVYTAAAYKKASQKGVKLVFMDNVPSGFKAGKDYVSVVSADNYGNGVASALQLGKTCLRHGKPFTIRMRPPAYKMESNDRDKLKLAPYEEQGGRGTLCPSKSHRRTV